MKTFNTAKICKIASPLVIAASLALISGCATGKSDSGQEISRTGPTVLDTRTNPGTFSLNQNLQPMSQAQILADIKDFQGKVQDVRLRFTHIPIEVRMTQVTPSTWMATLTQDQLKQLAVNGHTMKYEANVIARDSVGQTGISQKPLEIAIKAPDITSTG